MPLLLRRRFVIQLQVRKRMRKKAMTTAARTQRPQYDQLLR
jgi:hypothetical protein